MRDMGVYRGRRVDNGEWVEGYLVLHPGNAFILKSGYPIVNNEFYAPPSWWWAVDPATVGEFVRVLHGKRVFEGDQGRHRVTGEIWTMAYIEKYQRFAWTKPGTVFAVIPDNRIELTGTTIWDKGDGNADHL